MTDHAEDISRLYGYLLASDEDPRKCLAFVERAMRDRGCTFSQGPMPVYVRPHFIDVRLLDAVAAITETMVTALNKIVDLCLGTPELRHLLELDEALERLIGHDPLSHAPVAVVRNDAFLNGDRLWHVEFNADSPAGPMYTDTHADVLKGLSFWDEIENRFTLAGPRVMQGVTDALLDAYRAMGGQAERPSIAVTGSRDEGTLPEFLAIVNWLRERGFECGFCDYRDWTYDGNVLESPEGLRPDVVYRRICVSDLIDSVEEAAPLLEAMRDRRVAVVNPLRSYIASRKSTLDLLQRTDLRQALTRSEHEAIDRSVPWTRKMRQGKTDYEGRQVDLYQFVRDNRVDLVLKPVDGYGGRDVCLGRYATQSEWDGWIERTAHEAFVVQKYVPIPEVEFPVKDSPLMLCNRKVNVNFYACAGRFAGGVARVSDSPIINVHRGGGMTPIVFVGPRTGEPKDDARTG